MAPHASGEDRSEGLAARTAVQSLRQPDDLPGGRVGLHVAVGVGDVVEREGGVDDVVQAPLPHRVGDPLQRVAERLAGERAALEAPQPHPGLARGGRGLRRVPDALEEAGQADAAAGAHRLQRAQERPGSDELEQPVDAVGHDLPHGRHEPAVVEDRVVGAAGAQDAQAVLAARRRDHGQPGVLGQRDGGPPDRRRPAAHEHRPPRRQPEDAERAPGRPEALREAAQPRPVERRRHGDDVRRRQEGVLLVPAVEVAAHAAHRGGHDLPGREVAAAGSTTSPTASIPRTRGKRTASPDPPARVTSSARFSPKARTRTSTQPGRGSGRGALLHPQDVGRPGGVDDGGAVGGGGHAASLGAAARPP